MNRKGRIYARQSLGKEDSISIEVQIGHGQDYAARHGIDLVAEPVVDQNFSGRKFANRQVRTMIDEVQAEQYEVIIVWKWSRWGRNLVESLLYKAQLEEADGFLESATEPMDSSTAAGNFSVNTLLAIADFESRRIGDGWKDARRSMMFKRGLPPNGGPRLGYDYSHRLYVPHPIAGPALTEAYTMYVNGASFHRVTDFMNSKGVTPNGAAVMNSHSLINAMDSGFAAGFIKLDKPQALLKPEEMTRYGVVKGKPALMPGVRRIDSGEIEPGWPALIPLELWNDYQQVRQERKNVAPRARNPRQHLSGFLRCAGCGRTMIFRPDRNRWTCSHQKFKGGEACPVKVTIDGDEVAGAVQSWLEAHRDGSEDVADALTERQMQAQSAQGDIAKLEREAKRLEDEMQKLVSFALSGAFTVEQIRPKREELEKAQEANRAALMTARRQVAVTALPASESFGAILSGWTLMPAEMVNRGLGTLIDEVFVYPFGGDQDRVRIRGVWQRDLKFPQAKPRDLDFTEGRTCLACKTWKSREHFYVLAAKGGLLMSRCKECKAATHRAKKTQAA